MVAEQERDRQEKLIREAGDSLLRLVRDPTEGAEVRHRAVWALGMLAYGPSAEPLAELLDSAADPVLRLEVVQALRRMDPADPGPALRNALDDDEPFVRIAAIRATTSLRDGGSVDALFELVASDPVEDVRLFALQSLAAWGVRGDQLLQTASRMLEDDSPAIRREAVGVLGDLGDLGASASMVLSLLRSDRDPEVRQAVAYSLVKLFREEDRDEIEEQLAEAAAPGRPAAAREAAVWALGEIGGAGGEEALRAIVRDRNDERGVRLAAIEAVGKIRSVAAVAELGEVLAREDEDPGIRRRAAEALGEIGDARAYAPLVGALEAESPEVREAAGVALQKIDADPIEAELLDQLRDHSSAEARAEAARLLAKRAGPAVALEPLIEALADAEYSVRESAAIGLSQFSDEESVLAIVAALGYEDFLVRQGAATALGLMGPEAPQVASQALRQHAAGDPSGAVVHWTIRAQAKGLKRPCAVVVDARDSLWVAECTARTLWEFRPGSDDPVRHDP